MVDSEQRCDRAVDNYLPALKCFPDCYITQKMCDKAVNTSILLQCILFLIAIKFKKCVIKLLINVFYHYLYS